MSKRGYHTYYQSAEEGKSRYSRLAAIVAPLVRELPLIALSVLSFGIWAPILVAVTLLAVALANLQSDRLLGKHFATRGRGLGFRTKSPRAPHNHTAQCFASHIRNRRFAPRVARKFGTPIARKG